MYLIDEFVVYRWALIKLKIQTSWRSQIFAFKYNSTFNAWVYSVNWICIGLFFQRNFSYSKNCVRHKHDKLKNFWRLRDNFSFMKSFYENDIYHSTNTIDFLMFDVVFWQTQSASKSISTYSKLLSNFLHNIRFFNFYQTFFWHACQRTL